MRARHEPLPDLVSSLLRDLVASSGEFELMARAPVALKGLDGEHVTYAVGWAVGAGGSGRAAAAGPNGARSQPASK